MTSIVGTWNMRVSWGSGLGAGKVLKTATKTVYEDGTWTNRDGGGRWVQVGDHIFWNFTHYPELVYCANTQFASMTGIMGWPHPGGKEAAFTGCAWACPEARTPPPPAAVPWRTRAPVAVSLTTTATRCLARCPTRSLAR